MSTAPNLLLTSEWLFPMLKEQLLVLHERLQQSPAIDRLPEIASGYQQVLEQIKVSEIADFINLAYLLEMMSTAMADTILPLDHIDITLAASESLLEALHHYVKIGTYEASEIIQQCQQLHDLLAAKNIRLDLQLNPLTGNGIKTQSQKQAPPSASQKIDNETDNTEAFLIHDELTDAELDELERQLNPNYVAHQNDNNAPAKSHVSDAAVVDVTFDEIETPTDSQTNDDKGGEDAEHTAIAPLASQSKAKDAQALLKPMLDELSLPSDAKDSDPEIKAIFVEEAHEVLEALFEHRKSLKDKDADLITEKEDVIREIRRGFHTLKGSGRMVGAYHTAELAWAVESMLNRVLEGSLILSDGMMQLVDEVIEGYPALIDCFETAESYPEQLQIWTASALLYAQNTDASFDYTQLNPDRDAKPVEDSSDSLTLTDDSGEHANLDNAEVPAAMLVLEEMTTANARLKEAAHLSLTELQDKDTDTELQQVFAAEAIELLADIDSALAKAAGQDSVEVDDALVRAFHTLRGAASSQSLTAIRDISATVESSLEQLQQQDEPMTASHIQAIAQSAALIRSYINTHQARAATASTQQIQQDIDHFNDAFDRSWSDEADQDKPFKVADLIDERVDDLLEAQWALADVFEQADDQGVAAYADKLSHQCQLLLERVQGSQKFVTIISALQQLYQHIKHTPWFAHNTEVVDTLIEGHNQLTELLDSLAGSMTLRLDAAVVDTLNSLSAQARLLTPTSDRNKPAEAAKQDADGAQDAAPTVQIEQITTDAELLEIFLEEAKQLDTDADQQLNLWQQQPDGIAPVAVLQRHLHTIKGGARMAGIDSIAELMHEAETLYEYFVAGQITPNAAWIEVMQAVQDTLASQIHYLATQGASFYVPDLIEQLQTLARTKHLPKAYRLKLPKLPNTPSTTKPVSLAAISTENEVTQAADVSVSAKSAIDQEDESSAVEAAITSAPHPLDRLQQETDAVPQDKVDSIELEFDRLKSESWADNAPDPDIVAIFLEEADEVLGNIKSYFQAFRSAVTQQTESAPIPTQTLSTVLTHLPGELQKLKGGAHMVYANAVAEVTHQLEMVYTELLKRSSVSTSLYQLLALTHEWLEQAVYLIKQGINPPAAEALVAALDNYKKHPDAQLSLPNVSLQGYIQAIDRYQKWRDARLGLRDISHMPAHLAKSANPESQSALSSDMIRVPSSLMEQMINLSGESAIHRSRIELTVGSVGNTIREMESTVQRLAEQLRRMDIELETQVRSQIDEQLKAEAGFDPLEMDQYSIFNQLSKSLSESASDLLEIKATLQEKTRDTEGLLLQLSQTQTELQQGLMTSRMMPFATISPRLQRTVRQTASELGKRVDLVIVNEQNDIDRMVLERITAPLEHMLRNAVDHGIESLEQRQQAGKPEAGRIVIDINREGGEIVIRVSDDGQGIDIDSVRQKAISRGLINKDDTTLSDMEVMQYIFHAGLSTANSLTQISGRGVGMDVVLSEVRQLGGTVSVQSEAGQGSVFLLRLPLTIDMTEALVVGAANQRFAVPLIQIDRIERLNGATLLDYYQSNDKTMSIAGDEYRVHYLNEILFATAFTEQSVSSDSSLPVIILKNQAGQKLALHVDEIMGSRIDVVVKALGQPLTNIAGFSAATITGDGMVMLILDALDLIRHAPAPSRLSVSTRRASAKQASKRSIPQILIVDDSVTVRKVTSRILERQGYKTFVARDGVEALDMLQSLTPDVMLLDIEMPRMDGFEVASHVRRDPQLTTLPIIMITSRTGDKHHQRARQLGVNAYLGKPFQEALLISTIQSLIKQASGVSSGESYALR